MIPAVAVPLGWYDPPQGIVHCDCDPCEVQGCGAKNESFRCEHGEDDPVCDHKFCCDCGKLLTGDETDMCDVHQLVYDMVANEVGR